MKDKNDFNWSLDVIRTFHILNQTKSISQTAEKTGISQSAVTQKISKLEKILGRKLWQRRGSQPGQVSFTGDRFAEYASEILNLAGLILTSDLQLY